MGKLYYIEVDAFPGGFILGFLSYKTQGCFVFTEGFNKKPVGVSFGGWLNETSLGVSFEWFCQTI